MSTPCTPTLSHELCFGDVADEVIRPGEEAEFLLCVDVVGFEGFGFGVSILLMRFRHSNSTVEIVNEHVKQYQERLSRFEETLDSEDETSISLPLSPKEQCPIPITSKSDPRLQMLCSKSRPNSKMQTISADLDPQESRNPT